MSFVGNNKQQTTMETTLGCEAKWPKGVKRNCDGSNTTHLNQSDATKDSCQNTLYRRTTHQGIGLRDTSSDPEKGATVRRYKRRDEHTKSWSNGRKRFAKIPHCSLL